MSDEPGKRPGSGQRDGKGRFADGGGNPSGRPKDVHGISALARSKSPQAIDRLLEIGLKGKGTAAVLALREILDRGLGKPVAAVDITARAAETTAIAGNPDAARRRVEELIAAAEAATPALAALEAPTTNPQTVALEGTAQEGRVLTGAVIDAVASGLPGGTGEGAP